LPCFILMNSFWVTHSATLTVTVSDPKNDPTATQLNLNHSNRIWLNMNPKRLGDGSVERVTPLPKFLGICATISGHDLCASSINKNLGCP
jgi:hypothetical protein